MFRLGQYLRRTLIAFVDIQFSVLRRVVLDMCVVTDRCSCEVVVDHQTLCLATGIVSETGSAISSLLDRTRGKFNPSQNYGTLLDDDNHTCDTQTASISLRSTCTWTYHPHYYKQYRTELFTRTIALSTIHGFNSYSASISSTRTSPTRLLPRSPPSRALPSPYFSDILPWI